jgi:hypothetical protein
VHQLNSTTRSACCAGVGPSQPRPTLEAKHDHRLLPSGFPKQPTSPNGLGPAGPRSDDLSKPTQLILAPTTIVSPDPWAESYLDNKKPYATLKAERRVESMADLLQESTKFVPPQHLPLRRDDPGTRLCLPSTTGTSVFKSMAWIIRHIR